MDYREVAELMDRFDADVLPWCCENNLSLHRAFEISREKDKEKYEILSKLWENRSGRLYLNDTFRNNGGKLSVKVLEKYKQEMELLYINSNKE